MNLEFVKLEEKDSIAKIILNKPETYNAMSDDIRSDLKKIIDYINGSKTIHVVVLTGSGKSFSAGGDIKVMRENIEKGIPKREREEAYRNDCAGMVKAFNSIKQPLICAINGHAFGAGVSLALLCDIRIAKSSAKFGLPFAKRGLIPDWGSTYYLPRTIGKSKALLLSYFGNSLTAEQALDLGLVDFVYPEETYEEDLNKFLDELKDNSPYALRKAKEQINFACDHDLDAALENEGSIQADCYCSEDHKEGVMSFIEKRDAKFTGR